MAGVVTTLTKDVWTKVLTNVTDVGLVGILEQEEEPTEYFVAFVDTGDPAPAVGYEGGITIENSFKPTETVASDYYMMPVNNAGKVVIYA